jgi:hypothetical protein
LVHCMAINFVTGQVRHHDKQARIICTPYNLVLRTKQGGLLTPVKRYLFRFCFS